MTSTDRVQERRRAAALARHYRDEEGLSIAEIARRLGRAPATIKAYLYDPTGERAREVKERYRGVCRGCGASTSARNGKGDAYAYCKRMPSRRDRAGMGARPGARSDARLACPLRQPAVVLRLVGHPRTPAWRRSAQATTGRRLARTVHCDRSVRELGRGRRRRLRRRLNAWASMPLTDGCAVAVSRLWTGPLKVAENGSAHSIAPAASSHRRPAWWPPTGTNVGVDSDHRRRSPGQVGYRCGDEAAMRDSENARPRYAWSGSAEFGAAVTTEQQRRVPA